MTKVTGPNESTSRNYYVYKKGGSGRKVVTITHDIGSGAGSCGPRGWAAGLGTALGPRKPFEEAKT